jgi:hypothetical protein
MVAGPSIGALCESSIRSVTAGHCAARGCWQASSRLLAAVRLNGTLAREPLDPCGLPVQASHNASGPPLPRAGPAAAPAAAKQAARRVHQLPCARPHPLLAHRMLAPLLQPWHPCAHPLPPQSATSADPTVHATQALLYAVLNWGCDGPNGLLT